MLNNVGPKKGEVLKLVLNSVKMKNCSTFFFPVKKKNNSKWEKWVIPVFYISPDLMLYTYSC